MNASHELEAEVKTNSQNDVFSMIPTQLQRGNVLADVPEPSRSQFAPRLRARTIKLGLTQLFPA